MDFLIKDKDNKKNLIRVINKKVEVDKIYLDDLKKDVSDIKETLDNMKDNYNSNQSDPKETKKELKPFEVAEGDKPIQKNLRVYKSVAEEFKEFCNQHKELKQQQLVSIALKEFMEKYK